MLFTRATSLALAAGVSAAVLPRDPQNAASTSPYQRLWSVVDWTFTKDPFTFFFQIQAAPATLPDSTTTPQFTATCNSQYTPDELKVLTGSVISCKILASEKPVTVLVIPQDANSDTGEVPLQILLSWIDGSTLLQQLATFRANPGDNPTTKGSIPITFKYLHEPPTKT